MNGGSPAARELVPDDAILDAIVGSSRPSSVNIISNNWTTCTSRAKFENGCRPTFPDDVVVRLETSVGNLQVVTALQNVAAFEIPELVPKIHAVGKAVTANGKNIEYSVIEYVSDTDVLDSVWHNMHDAEKAQIAGQVAGTVKRLPKVRLDDARVQKLLERTPFLFDGVQKAFGGPRDGYAQDLHDFLARFVARHQKKIDTISTIEKTSDGAHIKSAQVSDLEVTFTHQELDIVSMTAALSHNDLEPRNILVKRTPSSNPALEPQYELAAIIDWEMAGFMPFTFEFGWTDAGLEASSSYCDWYKMFKQETRDLIPQDECFRELLRAVHFVIESKQASMKRNVNAEFCRRWRAREGVEWAEDAGGSILEGWILRQPSQSSKEADETLELQVLRDFGIIEGRDYYK